MAAEKTVGIYIHVPFCLSKCYYCDFCSVTRADGEKKRLYTERLCAEIADFSEKIKSSGDIAVADTVYFGGGTPTLLSCEQISTILDAVKKNFGITCDAEITAETNPRTLDASGLSALRKTGVNRLSIGMQSASDKELRALGRIHGFEDFKRSFSNARDAGFDNISCDLMYGIPLQTQQSFRASVETLMEFAPEHISSYCLTVEEGTNFHRRQNELELPDEDTVGDMYAEMSRLLCDGGYEKYEISNFSRVGRESKHNLKYWRCEDYLGFGPAAHSYFGGARFAHSYDIDAYLRGESIIIDNEPIGESKAMNEYVMLGMRLSSGVSFSDFFARFGVDFLQKFAKIEGYAPELVTIDDAGCRFTQKGMFVSNYVLSDILEFGE